MEAKQAISIVNFSMLKKKTNKKEVVWLKLDPKNQIAHFKTLLKSHVFYQINKENAEILQDCGSTFIDVMDQATFHPEDDPVILQEVDEDDNDSDVDRLGDDHDDNNDDSSNDNDGDSKNGNLDDGDDSNSNVDGGGGSNGNVYTDLEKRILLSELLPETLTI